MKLFELKNWNVIIAEQAYLLRPFKTILDNDKSKDKELATKELAFVWFFSDIKSDYNYILNEKEKAEEIRKDLKLDDKWKMSDDLKKAIDFYRERNKTVSSEILNNSLFIANKLSNEMKKTVEDNDLSIADIEKISKGLTQMPNIVASLQKLEQTVLKEINEKTDKVGSQTKALFEDGL
jgi:hypothetical protein